MADGRDESRIRALTREAFQREVTRVDALPAGLGTRRFYRVSLAGADAPRTLIARVEAPEDDAIRPPGVPPEPPLEPIRALLEREGLPVPRCHAAGPDLMLLEDAGGASLEQAAPSLPREERHALYREACGWLPRLQAIAPTPEVPNFQRHLDEALFAFKAEQVVDWVLPLCGASHAADAAAVREAFRFIAEVAHDAPQRLAHRDYKAANLHLHAREGGGRLTWIDLQGAFLAPPEYDLVCLLRDSQVELDAAFVEACLDEVRPRLPDAPDADVFHQRFELLTLTRNGKDLGRFLFAAQTRGDRRYLSAVPRAIRSLRGASARSAALDPRLARLADLFSALREPACGE